MHDKYFANTNPVVYREFYNKYPPIVFSERYMSSVCLSSVCLSSVVCRL